MSFNTPQEWKLNITPQDIFDIDSQDFNNYETLGDYLSQTIQTKSDLITALHFSKLHNKYLELFFTLSKVNPGNFKDWVKKIDQRIRFEVEEGWNLVDAIRLRKKNISIKLDQYQFSSTGDRWILSEEKKIPMTVETQLEYLDQLIDKWYFNMDNYNSRWQRINDLLHSMSCTIWWWNNAIYYKISYSKYIILESFKKNKLSDDCLYSLTKIQLRNSRHLSSLLDFLKNIENNINSNIMSDNPAVVEFFFNNRANVRRFFDYYNKFNQGKTFLLFVSHFFHHTNLPPLKYKYNIAIYFNVIF